MGLQIFLSSFLKFHRENFMRNIYFLALFIGLVGCSNIDSDATEKLTIFFINDPHGKLNNFAKIKHIVDQERSETNVMLVAGGDIFSGNPIVDQYSDKGFPIVDIMNKTGFDASALGNHEFDYGIEILNRRMDQSEFEWLCANVDASGSQFIQPKPYHTFEVGDLKVTILSFVETRGNPRMPSTHPNNIKDITFMAYETVAPKYETLKEKEGADVLLALTHLGNRTENELANNFPFMDLVIGGHTNNVKSELVNGIPVLMAGGNLSHLGKIELKIRDRKIMEHKTTLIDLSQYSEVDTELMTDIDVYNDAPEFNEVLGTSLTDLDGGEVGCLYSTAVREMLDVDVMFQNGGGVRSDLDEGDITKMEILKIAPFGNRAVIFDMTLDELESFLVSDIEGMHYTGINIQQEGTDLIFLDASDEILPDNFPMKVALNDYVATKYAEFLKPEREVLTLTMAEILMEYVDKVDTVSFEGCSRYFRYQ